MAIPEDRIVDSVNIEMEAQEDRRPNRIRPASTPTKQGEGPVAEDTKDDPEAQDTTRLGQKHPVSFTRWSLSHLLRLFIWYSLITTIFRCPSNLSGLDNSSPRLCKPYLVVRSHVEPHISPYYETYGAPYIETVRPYAKTFNEKIYTPTANFATRSYHSYGAPHVQKGVVYANKQWDTVVTPQLDSLQTSVINVYKSSVEPHYTHAVMLVKPYYQATSTHFDNAWQAYILPFYNHAKPVIGKAYSSTYDTAVNTVFPYSKKAWSSVILLINDTLLPGITGLYFENVEPQLVRIGEKLASYREGRKLGAGVEETESSTITSSSTTLAMPLGTSVSTIPTDSASVTVSASVPPPEKSTDKVSPAREQIADDLRTWQEKFAAAADKGAEDLEERVATMITGQIDGVKESGESFVTALETVTKQELESLKIKILDIVSNMPVDATDEDRELAEGHLVEAVRSSGLAIREAAQNLRQWLKRLNYDLFGQIVAAADATVEVLDQIRDLGLQQIGMRWAWMDGVTYKDWAKYHALKKQFHSWREEVRDVGLKHEAYEEIKALANDIVNTGMSIAETAAKELARLKQVGKWKIEAEDSSEDFETATANATEIRETKRLERKSQEETLTDSESERESEVPEQDPANEGSPVVTETPDASHSFTASESIDEDEIQTSALAAEQYDEASAVISSNSSPTPEPAEDEETPGTEGKVSGGAAAEVVDRDDQVPADIPEQAHNEAYSQQSTTPDASSTMPSEQSSVPMPPPEASSVYWASVQQADELYNIAHSVASAQYSGSPDEKIVSSIESAYSGSLQDADEKFESRIQAASAYVGTTTSSATPIADSDILSTASARLQEDLESASRDLASSISGTAETPAPGQQIILDARRRYYEAVGLAHDQYSIFINSASATASSSTSSAAPPEETTAPANQPIVENANFEFSAVSSLASASLDAVLYSVSSAQATLEPESASSVVEGASSRFSDALSAATSSLASVSSVALETPVATESSQEGEDIVTSSPDTSTDTTAPSKTISENTASSSSPIAADVESTAKDEL
ncbi:hypothetical protein FQN53_001924 [Emmonsiellopsis sp. PD_33]|nr:hypothetical protein FQN53_001924 [Emmonsiellopsis sp. PD_33]KAK2791763.1 hypothetical protein FQN51_002127 [Onygenales sp. PD_10]